MFFNKIIYIIIKNKSCHNDNFICTAVPSLETQVLNNVDHCSPHIKCSLELMIKEE